jgi:hypothetical protein
MVSSLRRYVEVVARYKFCLTKAVYDEIGHARCEHFARPDLSSGIPSTWGSTAV